MLDKSCEKLTDMDLQHERDLESLEQKQLLALQLQPHQQHPTHAWSMRALAVQDVIQNVNIADATKRDVLFWRVKWDKNYGPAFVAQFSGKFGKAFASSEGTNDPFIAETVEHAALTAFAFTI